MSDCSLPVFDVMKVTDRMTKSGLEDHKTTDNNLLPPILDVSIILFLIHGFLTIFHAKSLVCIFVALGIIFCILVTRDFLKFVSKVSVDNQRLIFTKPNNYKAFNNNKVSAMDVTPDETKSTKGCPKSRLIAAKYHHKPRKRQLSKNQVKKQTRKNTYYQYMSFLLSLLGIHRILTFFIFHHFSSGLPMPFTSLVMDKKGPLLPSKEMYLSHLTKYQGYLHSFQKYLSLSKPFTSSIHSTFIIPSQNKFYLSNFSLLSKHHLDQGYQYPSNPPKDIFTNQGYQGPSSPPKDIFRDQGYQCPSSPLKDNFKEKWVALPQTVASKVDIPNNETNKLLVA